MIDELLKLSELQSAKRVSPAHAARQKRPARPMVQRLLPRGPHAAAWARGCVWVPHAAHRSAAPAAPLKPHMPWHAWYAAYLHFSNTAARHCSPDQPLAASSCSSSPASKHPDSPSVGMPRNPLTRRHPPSSCSAYPHPSPPPMLTPARLPTPILTPCTKCTAPGCRLRPWGNCLHHGRPPRLQHHRHQHQPLPGESAASASASLQLPWQLA